TQSTWKYSKNKNTFGWARAEVLGALVNSVFLLALCFSIFVEAIERMYEGKEVLHNPELILYVGVVGLVVNIIGLALLHKHGHGHSHGGGGGHGHSHGGASARRSSRQATINTLVATDDNENDQRLASGGSISIMAAAGGGAGGGTDGGDDERRTDKKRGKKSSVSMNMKGAFLHVLSDALGGVLGHVDTGEGGGEFVWSVVVIVSALIVWKTDFVYKSYVDPVLSMLLVLLISYTTWPLLKESALILLQTVPTHIQVRDMHVQVRDMHVQVRDMHVQVRDMHVQVRDA
ncbi:hypothetical protein HAZT_HAZT009935, partial [Hyalella azteca]